MPTTKPAVLTSKDLDKIASILTQAIKSQRSQTNQEYLDMLSLLVDTVHQLKITVEFEHETRLRALEEFVSEQ